MTPLGGSPLMLLLQLAGVLLGPSVLGVLAPGASNWLLPHSAEQMHLLQAVGQIGVLLLVGLVGSHLGAAMNARGVVEIVIASVGLRVGVLNTASYSIIVVIAVVTSLMAPPILRTAMRRVEQTADEQLRARAIDVEPTPAHRSGSAASS